MSAVSILAEAINYPEKVGEIETAYAFDVDGAEVRVKERSGRILLERTIWTGAGSDPDVVATMPCELADLAAGRILREEAIIAWDPQTDSMILWQDAPSSMPAQRMRLFFELFMASCDWWKDRTNEILGNAWVLPEMMILP